MSRQRLARGLYAITGSRLPRGLAVEVAVEQAIAGGARVIQYREKHLHGAARRVLAERIAQACRAHDIPLLINDDVELAMHCEAAGVHLGRYDTPLLAARRRLGKHAIIGVSCYSSVERALDFAAAGADYVAFGRFFPSRSKPEAVQAAPAILAAARAKLDIPLVAIGGITAANAAPLLAAGADLLAAIDGVFGQADIEAAARGYSQLFVS